MATEAASINFRGINGRGMGAPILLIMMLAMIVIPMPPIALDMLFSFNIALSLVVLMVTVYALRPLDFGIFPTVLLITTLLRLALNVASTRVVLLNGHTGTGAAGKVIESFGEFVVGGNYAVGLVVFAILVIINFVVSPKVPDVFRKSAHVSPWMPCRVNRWPSMRISTRGLLPRMKHASGAKRSARRLISTVPWTVPASLSAAMPLPVF